MSGWLNSKQAAEHLGFPSVPAFRNWKTRHGAPKGYRIGRKLRFKRTDLDKLVEHERAKGEQ